MKNEYYAFSSVATTPTEDYFMHYGIKGMKWGVRKAIATGDQKKLDRHFRKAAKKLAKLQDIAINSKKYAIKAGAYGAAAVGTGTLAISGTSGISGFFKRKSDKYSQVSKQISDGRYQYLPAEKAREFAATSEKMKSIANNIDNWGNQQSSIFKPRDVIAYKGNNIWKLEHTKGLKKGDVARLATGLAAIGLGAKAAQNAYRALNGPKYREKAVQFKNAMDNEFAGTKYEGQYVVPPKQRKKRR